MSKTNKISAPPAYTSQAPMGYLGPQQPYPMGPPAPQQPYPMGYPAPQQPYPMGYPGSITTNQTVVVNQPAAPSVTVVPPVDSRKVGSCPVCKVGKLSDDFTCCGICLGIFLFPCGLICCCTMRQRRCNNCKANFG